MEAGADDIRPVTSDEDDGAPVAGAFKVLTPVEGFGAAVAKLQELGFSVNAEACELVYVPAAEVEVDDEAFAK